MRARFNVGYIAFTLWSCAQPEVEPSPTSCVEATERVGSRVCVHVVGDEATFSSLSVPFAGSRVTKYLAPASDDSRVEALVMDVRTFSLHYELLSLGFPSRFPGLTRARYLELIADPAEREFFAGTLTMSTDDDGRWVGFRVVEDAAQRHGSPSMAQVESIWRAFLDDPGLPRLTYVPDTDRQRAVAAQWDAPFPIRGVASTNYEAYTQGEAFGRVQIYDPRGFAQATEVGSYGWRDILVLEQAPIDVERVIAGSVTGTRQGILSHLNVRAAGRGSPNCYVPDVRSVFSSFEGELVRVACEERELSVRLASVQEAERWWRSFRPDPIDVPSADRDWTAIEGLLDVPVDAASDRLTAVRRYGAKGANLATLYRYVEPQVQLTGLLVPMSYGHSFLRDTTWTVDLGDGAAEHGFLETVDAWMLDDEFRSDVAVRRRRLSALRSAIRGREDAVSDELIDALSVEIRGAWGADTTMVRFRSSSNAEDALGFSGAGLYDSTSACLADELDADDVGPSLCDVDNPRERTLRRALLKVWASQFNAAAWEERDWFGIAHDQVSVGVLVNTRSKDERANVVAFTGDPTGSDERFLINAQVGHLDVVSSEPGVYPEMTWAQVNAGRVGLERVRGSSELSAGRWVLDDEGNEAIALILDQLVVDFPIDDDIPSGRSVLLDTEWKVQSDGRLVIKQIRPHLR